MHGETVKLKGLMSFSPMEYGFLHLAICNDIKYDAVRSEVSVVEAWEIIFFSILNASLLCIKNSVGLLTRLECFALRCRISRDGFIASFPRTVTQMTH